MKKLILFILLLGMAIAVNAQVNGSLQQLGDKKILKVWGDHFDRGKAQGYYLAPQIMDVFDDFFWTMFCFSSNSFYDYITQYYQNHFASDPDLELELSGMINGMEQAGQSLYHQGLNRQLGTLDLLLMNSVYDLVEVQQSKSGNTNLKLGCASLASWGTATAADTLLAGSSVITRFLDISQNSALINNPLMVVHFPSEVGEQTWLNITLPGFIGAITAINSCGIYASMNTATDFNSINPSQPVTPILFDIRKGVERMDYNNNGIRNSLDVFASIQAGNHLSEFAIQILDEANNQIFSAVVETKYGTTVYRTTAQYSNLPANNLAATNHFRMLASPACCNRYYLIQDSLYTNGQVNAKRQWILMGGAAGLETTLSAVQWTPSTGLLLWASATETEPAYQKAPIPLNTSDLFSYTVSNQDEYIPTLQKQLSIYPNPLKTGDRLQLKSGSGIKQVQVYNLKGQRVFSSQQLESTRSYNPSFDLNLSRAGIYILKAKFGDGTQQSQKLVVF